MRDGARQWRKPLTLAVNPPGHRMSEPRFYYTKQLIWDEPLRKAVVDWAIDELQKDVAANQGKILCFVYGIAYRQEIADGARVAFFTKTGGAEDFKPMLAMQMIEGLNEAVKKTGWGFIDKMPLWRRLAFRLLMALPKL